MPDRNRGILVAVLALAAVLLVGYASATVLFIARGDLEAGPLRLLTVAADLVAGALAAVAAVAFGRQRPRR